jgi:hypothetical protein
LRVDPWVSKVSSCQNLEVVRERESYFAKRSARVDSKSCVHWLHMISTQCR